MDKLVIGILAHVDAGKTTLSEAMMYLTGLIRKPGRVDHGDTFLDNFALERARGITIFSKQAVFQTGDKEVTLLDTPGHADFSAEMERTLSVLDYAVLVISGPDGVQGHTETLWRLLREYRIPTFLFINKMDQEGADREEILENLKNYLSDNCLPFDGRLSEEAFQEALAMTDEEALEKVLEGDGLSVSDIRRLIAQRKVFPCWFGSALKLEGVEEFLQGLAGYTVSPSYGKDFAARVFKVTRDEQGNRLTHVKVTGGRLKVKEALGDDKVDQIRLYSGPRYTLLEEADAGCVCALTGLAGTQAGDGLGAETGQVRPILAPVMSCQLILPEGTDLVKALRNLRELEEEEPELHVVWNPGLSEIQVQMMGDVQKEILAGLIEERYHLKVSFGQEHIMYRETIRGSVPGVGHYEPLRHYAEVHLRLSEGEPGSGLVFESECDEDHLDRNWQRLILTHLYEKDHAGVLTGAPITDMKITLTAGRAHLKHTEGGDFRQATYRAVRQGLMTALAGGQSVLLEPWYSFRMELPSDQLGRGMSDIVRMSGRFDEPEIVGDRAVLCGYAPASEMMDYQKELWAYTGGRGRLLVKSAGYEPCHDQDRVAAELAYEPERDQDNPSGSIFCAHGAGFFVPWDQVPRYMHIHDQTAPAGGEEDQDRQEMRRPVSASRPGRSDRELSYAEDKELMEIFEREFGPAKERNAQKASVYSGYRKDFDEGTGQDRVRHPVRTEKKEKEYLLVDGYNIIYAWEELDQLAQTSLDAARSKLTDILCNYQGYVGCELILVFDAYKVKGNRREVIRYHNIHIVFTREAETADEYIEKTTHELGRKHHVRVATSDALEQVIVMGQGALRVSARDFYEEVEEVNRQIRLINEEKRKAGHNYLFDHMDQELADRMENVRLGKEELQ